MNAMWVIFVSSLLNLDNVSAFQFLISRPSFTGCVLGYLTGNLLYGFLMGLMIELVVLDFTPVGGIAIPNATVAITITLLLLEKTDPYFAFFLGLVSGEGYSYVEKNLREYRKMFNRVVEDMIKSYKFNFGRIIIFSLLLEVLVFFLYTLIVYYILGFIVMKINSHYLFKAFRIAFIGTIFITLTSLYFKFKTQVSKK